MQIVVFHHDFRHHLRRHVVAVGVVLAVDRIGIDVVLRHEDQATLHALRETREDLDLFRATRGRAQLGVFALGSSGPEFMRPANVARNGGRCDHFRAREITFRIARSHAALEVPVGGGDADFARFEQANAQPDARPASGRQRVRARIHQRLPRAALLRFFLHPLAGCAEVKLHAGGNFLAPQNFRRRFQVFYS